MNAPLPSTPRMEAFFFDAEPGTRFSLYHAPSPHLPARGAILYVHPFGEELNRTRRMAMLQARRFAASGFAVLQIDLFGCGDSCGDFSAARWHIWQRDLAAARNWLADRIKGPMYLWGLRLGALLALEVAATEPVDGLILWQPYTHGRNCINQFLRQRLSEPHAGHGDEQAYSTAALRARLAAQGSIEVAGYTLDAALARAIDHCDAAALPVPACPIHWFACSTPAPSRLAANAARLADSWAPYGAALHLHTVQGVPFWSAGQPDECHALLAATDAIFAEPAP